MKRTRYDYSGFRISRINEPEFRHIWLALSWIPYLAAYFIGAKAISPEVCTSIHCKLDDLIPFNEIFLIPYISWYFFLAIPLLYFFLYDVPSFRKLQTYILIAQTVSVLIFHLFPTRIDLRPEQFPRENCLTWATGVIYSADRNMQVFPSLHVALSIAVMSVVTKQKYIPVGWRIFTAVWTPLICLSTVFVKQHSFLDGLAATVLCLFIEAILYGKNYLELFRTGKTDFHSSRDVKMQPL